MYERFTAISEFRMVCSVTARSILLYVTLIEKHKQVWDAAFHAPTPDGVVTHGRS